MTNQGADIGSTNLANGGAVGTYRVSCYLEDTAADAAAGTVTVTFAFTDANGATTVAVGPISLTGIAGVPRASSVFFAQQASGNISYSTAHTGIFGTGKYALYICLERLS